MPNTQIICTIGPASRDKELIKKMLMSGMDTACFNMSRDSAATHGAAVSLAREAAREMRLPLKIMIELKSKARPKGANFPNIDPEPSCLSEADKNDIAFAAGIKADMIALSFVSRAENVLAARDWLLRAGGSGIRLISKIEGRLGVDNIEEIIAVSDGIMITHELGAEIPVERLPHIQKDIICRCLNKDRFVITAAEMLKSMTENTRPTRAEATDVANAVYDGTDAVLLSGETADGKHPALAVEYMYKLIDTAEFYIFSFSAQYMPAF